MRFAVRISSMPIVKAYCGTRDGSLNAPAFAARVLRDIPGAVLHGSLDAERTLPGIVNFGFEGITGEELLFSLDLDGLCVSNGSACSAGSAEPSRTLMAMGLSAAEAKGAVRFSFGVMNGEEDAEAAFVILKRAVERLRGL